MMNSGKIYICPQRCDINFLMITGKDAVEVSVKIMREFGLITRFVWKPRRLKWFY
jgi:hypothetical protein